MKLNLYLINFMKKIGQIDIHLFEDGSVSPVLHGVPNGMSLKEWLSILKESILVLKRNRKEIKNPLYEELFEEIIKNKR